MGINMPQSSYDEIIYYLNAQDNELEPIKGVIVAYKDNVYYVSNEHRNLVTIKGEFVKTEPYKDKK